MDAAKTVFGEHGFQGSTVRQICAEAGLTERYFYESFDNPVALFEAVYDRELEVLNETLDAAIAGASRAPETLALALTEAYFGLLRADPKLARILIIEVYGTATNISKLYRRGVLQFANKIKLVLADAMTPASSPKLDADLLATALLGAASHLAMRWFLGGYREPQEVMVAHCHGVFAAVIQQLKKTALNGSSVSG